VAIQHPAHHLQLLPSEPPIPKGSFQAACQYIICKLCQWGRLKGGQVSGQVQVATDAGVDGRGGPGGQGGCLSITAAASRDWLQA